MSGSFSCPYCSVTDDRLGVHGHLFEEHSDEMDVEIVRVDHERGIEFTLTCPECNSEEFAKTIPRFTGDAERVAETYRDELAMIAFDQLLYHLEDDHGY